jgi:predicted dehydrogenase
VLNDPAIEALIIATPVMSHYTLARKALEHGKHVLIEKPLTIRVSDAEELVDLAERRGLKLMVDHITIYSGAFQAIKQLIDSALLGRLLFVNATRVSLGVIQNDVSVLWDLAVHEVAMIDHLLAKGPVAVSATGAAFYGPFAEIVHADLCFDDGLVAHVYVSWLSPFRSRKFVVGGVKKMLVFDDMLSDNKVNVCDRGVDISLDAGTGKAAYLYRDHPCNIVDYDRNEPVRVMIDDFVRCVDEDRTPMADGEAGLRVVRTLEAVEKSMRMHGTKVTAATSG